MPSYLFGQIKYEDSRIKMNELAFSGPISPKFMRRTDLAVTQIKYIIVNLQIVYQFLFQIYIAVPSAKIITFLHVNAAQKIEKGI